MGLPSLRDAFRSGERRQLSSAGYGRLCIGSFVVPFAFRSIGPFPRFERTFGAEYGRVSRPGQTAIGRPPLQARRGIGVCRPRDLCRESNYAGGPVRKHHKISTKPVRFVLAVILLILASVFRLSVM